MTKLTFAAGLLAQNTDDHYTVLLTLTHPTFAAVPIQLSVIYKLNDEETAEAGFPVYGIESNNKFYQYCPFDLTLPSSEEGGASETQLTVQNVDKKIGDMIKALTGDPIKCQMQVITVEEPDYVEVNLPAYELVGIGVYGHQVIGTLTQRNMVEQPYGIVRIIPSTSPIWFR